MSWVSVLQTNFSEDTNTLLWPVKKRIYLILHSGLNTWIMLLKVKFQATSSNTVTTWNWFSGLKVISITNYAPRKIPVDILDICFTNKQNHSNSQILILETKIIEFRVTFFPAPQWSSINFVRNFWKKKMDRTLNQLLKRLSELFNLQISANLS